jgi:release factor glutamine methyltransferase
MVHGNSDITGHQGLRIDTAINDATQTLSQEAESELLSILRLEAEILLAHCLNRSRTSLRTWPEQTLSADQLSQFKDLIRRRQAGEPIAYLTGQREFWDISLKVNDATLIPRSDTELLVERALDMIPTTQPWQIADLGTGSGAIALVIAKHRPHCQIIATDASPAALQVATENRDALGINNVIFQESNWFASLSAQVFQLIVSNPPYVAENDPHLSQGDLRFEPQTALTSGLDGLNDLRDIIQHSPLHLTPGGWLLVEHGYQQSTAVMDLFQAAGFNRIQCYHDAGQRERVTKGQISL